MSSKRKRPLAETALPPSQAPARKSRGAGRFIPLPPPAWLEPVLRNGPWIVLAAAFVLRLAHWLSVRANDPLYAQTFEGFDMHTYLAWARNLAAGGDWLSASFTGPKPFYYGPLYPCLFLGPLFKIFGENFDLVHGLQALIALAPPLLVYAAGKRLFGAGAGLVAGLLTAFCAPFIFYEQTLLMEGILIALHAGILYCLARGGDSSRPWGWFLVAGLLSGLACWGRGNFMLVLPMLAAGLFAQAFFSARTAGGADCENNEVINDNAPAPVAARLSPWWVRGILHGAVFVFGASLLLGLSLWRNIRVSGDPVLITDNGPIILYITNVRDATGVWTYTPVYYEAEKRQKELQQKQEALAAALKSAVEKKQDAQAVQLRAEKQALDKQLANFWKTEFFKEVRSYPLDWLGLLARKTYMFWNSYDAADNVSYYANKRYSWVFAFSPVTWLTVVPLGVIGILLTARQWRRQIPFYFYELGFSFSIILFFINGRYRVEALLPMLLWAGAAASLLLEKYWRREWVPCMAAAGGYLAGILVLWPSLSPGARINSFLGPDAEVPMVRSNDYLSLASAHLKLRQKMEARSLLEEALTHYSRLEQIPARLAMIYSDMGEHRKAIDLLERQLSKKEAGEDTALLLAQLYIETNALAQANELLNSILKFNPQSERAKRLQPYLHSLMQRNKP